MFVELIPIWIPAIGLGILYLLGKTVRSERDGAPPWFWATFGALILSMFFFGKV